MSPREMMVVDLDLLDEWANALKQGMTKAEWVARDDVPNTLSRSDLDKVWKMVGQWAAINDEDGDLYE